jgi:hypothetical protein
MNKAQELAEIFFNELKWFASAKDRYTKNAYETFSKMIEKGVDPEEIRAKIYEYKAAHPTAEELSKLYSAEKIFNNTPHPTKTKGIKKDIGLMEDGKFYFHPRLQVAPKPPTIVLTEDGEFISSYDNEKFFLTMIDSFSMDDLMNYFYSKAGVVRSNYNRDAKGFEYFFKQVMIDDPLNALDLVLFTIDAAVALAYDKDQPMPKVAVELVEYIDDGLALYEEKYNYCKLVGLDHVT